MLWRRTEILCYDGVQKYYVMTAYRNIMLWRRTEILCYDGVHKYYVMTAYRNIMLWRRTEILCYYGVQKYYVMTAYRNIMLWRRTEILCYDGVQKTATCTLQPAGGKTYSGVVILPKFILYNGACFINGDGFVTANIMTSWQRCKTKTINCPSGFSFAMR